MTKNVGNNFFLSTYSDKKVRCQINSHIVASNSISVFPQSNLNVSRNN